MALACQFISRTNQSPRWWPSSGSSNGVSHTRRATSIPKLRPSSCRIIWRKTMDIKPARPVKRQPTRTSAGTPKAESDEGTPLKVPEELLGSGKKTPLLTPKTPGSSRKKWWILGSLAALVLLLVIAVATTLWWYNDALQPKSASAQRIRVVVAQGSTPDQISKQLQDSGVIKNSLAFQWLVRQSGDRNKLQAGTYLLSPTLSAREVLQWLVEGKVDTFNVTILPGQTLAQIKDKLIRDGFAAADIDKIGRA